MRKTGPNHGLGYIIFPETVIYLVIILKCVRLNLLITEPELLLYLLFCEILRCVRDILRCVWDDFVQVCMKQPAEYVSISFVASILLPKNL